MEKGSLKPKFLKKNRRKKQILKKLSFSSFFLYINEIFYQLSLKKKEKKKGEYISDN